MSCKAHKYPEGKIHSLNAKALVIHTKHCALNGLIKRSQYNKYFCKLYNMSLDLSKILQSAENTLIY